MFNSEDLTTIISSIYEGKEVLISALSVNGNLAVARITSEPDGNLTKYSMTLSSQKKTFFLYTYAAADAVHFVMKNFVEEASHWQTMQVMHLFSTSKA